MEILRILLVDFIFGFKYVLILDSLENENIGVFIVKKFGFFIRLVWYFKFLSFLLSMSLVVIFIIGIFVILFKIGIVLFV